LASRCSYAPGRNVEPERCRDAQRLGALLALLSVHAAGVFLDFMASIRYPFQWDYGEGIVWQQAALIPGPLMYSNSQSLPFIVFQFLHNVIGYNINSFSPRHAYWVFWP
jgi:hypothetical protein